MTCASFKLCASSIHTSSDARESTSPERVNDTDFCWLLLAFGAVGYPRPNVIHRNKNDHKWKNDRSNYIFNLLTARTLFLFLWLDVDKVKPSKKDLCTLWSQGLAYLTIPNNPFWRSSGIVQNKALKSRSRPSQIFLCALRNGLFQSTSILQTGMLCGYSDVAMAR